MVKFEDCLSGSIRPSYDVFNKMLCYSGTSKSSNDYPIDLKTLDEDKMRCQVLDCLIALCRVQKQKDIEGISHQYESAKRRIFAAAIALIIDEIVPVESDQHIITSLLASFPDSRKMTDDRKWLPLHFAVALGNEVSEEDVHILYSSEPLAIRRHDFPTSGHIREEAYTPGHLLCMQTHPNIALIRYLSLRDIKAFSILTIPQSYKAAKNCLQLASRYSVSVELLIILLQVNHSMTKAYGVNNRTITSLGLLCERSRCMFPSFNAMLECLTTADSSNEVVNNAIVLYFKSFERIRCTDMKLALSLIETLLERIDDTKILNAAIQSACKDLNGEYCVAVLSLILDKYSVETMAALRVYSKEGDLPVHLAAKWSSLDVIQFLLAAWPESSSELTREDENLLHMALSDNNDDRETVNAKVQYLCERYPKLIQMTNSSNMTPFIDFLCNSTLDLDTMKIMCKADETIVSEEYVSNEADDEEDRMLPLGWLCVYRQMYLHSKVVTSCFCFLLHLYPAALSAQDQRLYTQIEDLEDDFIIRLVLNADRSLSPERARDLNYDARKEGMFLAFGAVTNDGEPTIWIKLRHESKDLLMHTISYL